jgi:hypothetical protein
MLRLAIQVIRLIGRAARSWIAFGFATRATAPFHNGQQKGTEDIAAEQPKRIVELMSRRGLVEPFVRKARTASPGRLGMNCSSSGPSVARQPTTSRACT